MTGKENGGKGTTTTLKSDSAQSAHDILRFHMPARYRMHTYPGEGNVTRTDRETQYNTSFCRCEIYDQNH